MKRFLLSILFICVSFFAFSQISINVNVQNVTCFGLANGSATVNATGGTPAYSYTWLPSGQTTSNISNLSAGQYTVIVSDALLSINSYSFIVSEPNQLSINSQVFYDCYTPCNNSALANIMGGTPPYIYLWSNNSITTQTVGSLCSGNYSVQITDANGCMDTSLFYIHPIVPINISVTQTNTSCSTICNGKADFTISGGVGPFYYTLFSFPNVAMTPTLNLTNLCAGGYTITVTDSVTQCLSANSVYITSIGNDTIPNAILTALVYNESCSLSGDGMIDLSISGSNSGPFNYIWSNNATTQDVFNLVSGIYSVTVIDSNLNCTTLIDTIASLGINCGTISGNVYIDVNSDCINNTGDYGFNNMQVVINPGNRLGYTNSQGNYSVNNLPYGTYSISLNPSNNNISPSCTTTITTVVSSPSPTSVSNNLSVAFNNSTQPDMTVFTLSSGIVPGFSCSVFYVVQNLNPVNSNGLLKITLPSLYVPNVVGASPSIYTVSGDTIIWNFSNLNYYNYYSSVFTIYFNVPVNIPLGSTLTTCAYVETSIPDLNYTNNTNCYTRLVTGSFDPNDKTVSPVGIGATGDISLSDVDLTYLIRFQNTGNGPAVNIVVKDTLSSNVDVNTFEMIGASHNYNIEILSGNILKWKFNNIMLPDSGSNEPASHGYIQYKIKRNSNNMIGTQIKNTAYIYFDFNEPVVTNTTLNTISNFLSVYENKNDGTHFVYPNPTNSVLNIFDAHNQLKNSIIEIKNYLGQVVFTSPFISQIDLHNFSAGMYFLTFKGINSKTIKIIKE